MPSAIILLNTAIGMEKDVLNWLKSYEFVEEAFAVQSVYDIIGKVKTESFEKLKEAIAKIKSSLPKTSNIVTMFIVDSTSTIR